MTRFLYTLALGALLPWVLLRLLWRARRQPEYLRHLPERFGFYRQRPQAPLIWLHAVSVGETRAAQPLINALREAYPQHQILLTHMTPTGRATGEQVFGGSVLRCYLPYDYPFAVRRFLRRFHPAMGVLLETEIWFNLIHQCKRHGVPLYLVNARLSQKSAAKYARLPGLARAAFGELAAIAAQTRDDAARLLALGASPPHVTGNLKFDIAPPAAMLALGTAWHESWGKRPVLLCASTREGEEALLLDALEKTEVPGLLLVLVPRHPQRFEEVAGLLQGRGLKFQRRSANERIAADTGVLLGDSMGELFAYYAACDVAFVGGSLLPYGGQNLIEACAAGKPVLLGPHTYNFTEAARLAVEAGAALQLHSAAELVREAQRLLCDEAWRNTMAQKALAFSVAHRGATQKTLELLRINPPAAD